MKMRIGYSVDADETVGQVICRVTGGPFSHTLIVFDDVDQTGLTGSFYFESISKRDPNTRKTGVRGPIPLVNLLDWQKENPGSRSIEFSAHLPMDKDELKDAWRKLQAAKRRIKYAYLQCANNWIESRLGIYIHFGRKRGVKRWNCSETVIRILPSRFWIYFDLLDCRADDIVPSGSKMESVREGVRKLLEAHYGAH